MSRTHRKKYVPIGDVYNAEEFEKAKKESQYYATHGYDEQGRKWFSTNYEHRGNLHIVRVMNSIGRDGNKPHRSLHMIAENAIKHCSDKIRPVLNQELRNMRAGNLGWDENIHNVAKLKAFYRGLRFWDI